MVNCQGRVKTSPWWPQLSEMAQPSALGDHWVPLLWEWSLRKWRHSAFPLSVPKTRYTFSVFAT